jgi:hypothetical protein
MYDVVKLPWGWYLGFEVVYKGLIQVVGKGDTCPLGSLSPQKYKLEVAGTMESCYPCPKTLKIWYAKIYIAVPISCLFPRASVVFTFRWRTPISLQNTISISNNRPQGTLVWSQRSTLSSRHITQPIKGLFIRWTNSTSRRIASTIERSFPSEDMRSKRVDVPPNHLLLDSCPNIVPLISRWVLDKFKNYWNKSFRTSKILPLLYQQFSNLLISQRDMSGPRLGALSNNRWLGGNQNEESVKRMMSGEKVGCFSMRQRKIITTETIHI